MSSDLQQPVFYRALMTALFVGIVSTLLTMFFDLVYVEYFHFPLSAIINVASLIFFVNILFVVIGFIYYGFISAFKKGEALYIVVFILLTVFFVWKSEGVHRTDDQQVNLQFRSLLSGIVIIMGLLASLAIPFLFHNKQFERHVL
jgi:hypothetical protein